MTELLARLEQIGRGLSCPVPDGGASGARADADLCVITIIRDLNLATFLYGTLDFALRVPPELRDRWYRTFTKTLFFAGNPAHLAKRYSFDHVAADGSIAWLGPVERHRHQGLSPMLRLFRGTGPPPGLSATLRLTVPGRRPSGRTAILRIATAGVSTENYLVNANHVLCEAAFRGLVRPGDSLMVHHVDELDPLEALARRDGAAQLRIAEDSRHRGRLRLYAYLAED
ncbi:MAG TPA: DUF6182 family protein [Streptosporangiaceae bacterium]